MKRLSALALFLVACGSPAIVGTFDATTSPYDPTATYHASLAFTADKKVNIYQTTSGGTFGAPGCTATTTLAGTYTDTTAGKIETVTYTYTSGQDVYSGCTDTTLNKTSPYDAAKLASVSGPAIATFSSDNKTLTLTQSFGGQSYSATYTRK